MMSTCQAPSDVRIDPTPTAAAAPMSLPVAASAAFSPAVVVSAIVASAMAASAVAALAGCRRDAGARAENRRR
jgi:hypothetical protein